MVHVVNFMFVHFTKTENLGNNPMVVCFFCFPVAGPCAHGFLLSFKASPARNLGIH